eukprot:SAG22_NODE_11227_length_494_cov_23.253165_2_plen_89_part_01
MRSSEKLLESLVPAVEAHTYLTRPALPRTASAGAPTAANGSIEYLEAVWPRSATCGVPPRGWCRSAAAPAANLRVRQGGGVLGRGGADW